MFVGFFLRRPVFASVCAIAIVLAGALAIPSLPIAQYPDLAPPQVTVSATYLGASSDVVEQAVTIPLEQEINGGAGARPRGLAGTRRASGYRTLSARHAPATATRSRSSTRSPCG